MSYKMFEFWYKNADLNPFNVMEIMIDKSFYTISPVFYVLNF